MSDLAAAGPAWDIVTDPDNPQPLVYPVCKECHEPWSYKRCLNFRTGEYVWAWLAPDKAPKGCRHKAGPIVETSKVTA
jgi:hypothetical protein